MSTSIMTLPNLAPGRDIDAYMQTISAFPVLTRQRNDF